MVFVLGLTGSIGMGKSATAGLFRGLAVPVHDADAAVHALYENEAVAPVAEHFPEAVIDGRVERRILGGLVLNRPDKLRLLEAIVHPLVRRREEAFLRDAAGAGVFLAVLDIPLLFETGGEKRCDAVAVVSAPENVQRDRVLARPGMNEERLRDILARQMPDGEKRAKAHFIVDSSRGLADAECQVKDILRCLAGRPGHAWLRVRKMPPHPVATA